MKLLYEISCGTIPNTWSFIKLLLIAPAVLYYFLGHRNGFFISSPLVDEGKGPLPQAMRAVLENNTYPIHCHR